VKRTTRGWWAFAASAALVLAALGGITHVSLRLESREMAARAEARRQEVLRLALWRMDSALSPVVAREAARPWFHYSPFYKEDLAFNRALSNVQRGEVLVPSPLLAEETEFFRIHFQLAADGTLISPQAPAGAHCTVAVSNEFTTPEAVSSRRGLLERLGALVSFAELSGALERAERQAGAAGRAKAAEEVPPQFQSPQKWTADEFAVRQQAAGRAAKSPSQLREERSSPQGEVQQGAFLPLWLEGEAGSPELLFVRRVSAGERRSIQGVWTDWPKLERFLLDEVTDLLPAAALRPAPPGAAPPDGRLLANVPAVLEPSPLLGEPPAAGMTPPRLMLLLAWAAILAAVAAVGGVLGKSMDLGERRGQFVSAVTHELRTPLTTFRLYSQMLADGMVAGEESRKEYLATLKSEAERLSRVVENVLLYARVEENRRTARRERIDGAELIERALLKPREFAAASRRELTADLEAARGVLVEADPQAVEQVLLNLVDNSCKYAGGAEDLRLHVEARRAAGRLEVLYSDHGPGIPRGEEERVFSAFQRARREQSGAIPGIGLGLTLARGLARQLGGDLELVRSARAGAAFLLTLPA
jgi:signal transduction histidine kinase